MTISKAIQALFLDDESDIRTSMQADAAKKRIILKCFSSLEEGLEELNKNWSIRFVILDAKGFIRPDQVKGTENDSFALKAHRALDKLSKAQNRFLPYCYFTGHSDLRSMYADVDDFVVFDKNDTGVREKLFNHIWDTFHNSEEGILRKNYSELFEATDLINHPDATKGLISLLKCIQSNDYTSMANNLKGIFGEVRSLQELIYKALSQKDNTVIPNSYFRANGMIDFNQTKKHLTANNYQGQFIENITNATYWATGEYIHASLQRSYIPSVFGINALIYSVFELLIWFKSLYTSIK